MKESTQTAYENLRHSAKILLGWTEDYESLPPAEIIECLNRVFYWADTVKNDAKEFEGLYRAELRSDHE